MTPTRQGSEVFTFGTMRFNIDWVKEHIAAGAVAFTTEDLNIVPWAEQILCLDRTKPEHKPCALMMRIDYPYLDSISSDRLKDPIFIVETDMGLLLIDGNHRVAKAYMAGVDELPAIRFSQAAAKKLATPPKRRITILASS